MWQRFQKTFLKKWQKGFTIFIIPNSSRARIRSWKLPFSVLVLILGLILFNLGVLIGFPTQVWLVYRNHRAIVAKNRQISALLNSQKELLPNLQKCNQLEAELSKTKQTEIRLTTLWQNIQRKAGHSGLLASRGGLIRNKPYQLIPPATPTENIPISDKLRDNLAQLNSFINQEVEEQNQLIRQLTAYQIRLDCTPSIRPVYGSIASPFGMRFHPIWKRWIGHEGVDLAVGYGTRVRAAAAGVVVFSGWEEGYGRLIRIDHGYGYETRYGHNSRLLAAVGATVKKGQLIALSGNSGESTGPHLHYEVRLHGTPINPASFLKE